MSLEMGNVIRWRESGKVETVAMVCCDGRVMLQDERGSMYGPIKQEEIALKAIVEPSSLMVNTSGGWA